MRDVTTTGTVGDSWLTSLKLRAIPGDLHVHHTVEGPFDANLWDDKITQCLKQASNVLEVSFHDTVCEQYPRLHPYPGGEDDDIEVKTVFFPYRPEPEYLPFQGGGTYRVIVCHSGKPRGKGRNTKLLHPEVIESQLDDGPVVLLGTDAEYVNLDGKEVENLVCQTTLLEAIDIAFHAAEFWGPEGLLSFCALAGATPSTILYTSAEAVEKRIVGTPWEDSALLHPAYFLGNYIVPEGFGWAPEKKR